MGASPNKILTVEFNTASGAKWISFVEGQGDSPASHAGCSIGRIDHAAGASVAYPSLGRFYEVIGGAFQAITASDFTAIDDAFAGMDTAPGDGPWPAVKPSDWWDAKTATEKAAWCAIIVDKLHSAALAM